MSENTQPCQNVNREKKFILHNNANDVKKTFYDSLHEHKRLIEKF